MNNRGTRLWFIIAGLYGFSAVALGSIAAHVIADPQASAMVEKGALYGLIHAVALLAITPQIGRIAMAVRILWSLGILLFTGAIALKYLSGITAAGALAPLGGTCLLLGWLGIGLLGFSKARE